MSEWMDWIDGRASFLLWYLVGGRQLGRHSEWREPVFGDGEL